MVITCVNGGHPHSWFERFSDLSDFKPGLRNRKGINKGTLLKGRNAYTLISVQFKVLSVASFQQDSDVVGVGLHFVAH